MRRREKWSGREEKRERARKKRRDPNALIISTSASATRNRRKLGATANGKCNRALCFPPFHRRPFPPSSVLLLRSSCHSDSRHPPSPLCALVTRIFQRYAEMREMARMYTEREIREACPSTRTPATRRSLSVLHTRACTHIQRERDSVRSERNS